MSCEKVTTPEGTVFLCGRSTRRKAPRPALPDRQMSLEDAMTEDSGQCRSCAAPIEWAKTYKTDTPIPLDVGAAPAGTGNLLLLPESRKVVHLTKGEARWMEGLGAELRRSHFVTCPNRDEHRRSRGG